MAVGGPAGVAWQCGIYSIRRSTVGGVVYTRGSNAKMCAVTPMADDTRFPLSGGSSGGAGLVSLRTRGSPPTVSAAFASRFPVRQMDSPTRRNRCLLRLSLALLLAVPPASATMAGCAVSQSGRRSPRPLNLRHALRVLDRMISDADKDRLRSGELSPVQLHFGFGTYLRNSWGLWHRSSLALWFRVRGIWHADDMSSIILTSYVRKLRGEPIQLRSQIEHHKEYWRRVEAEEESAARDGRARQGAG